MSTDPPEAMLSRLAEHILTHKQEIINRWAEDVRQHSDIPSATRLTYRQMVDHLPELLDQLAEKLRQDNDPQAQEESRHDAALHGKVRWQQGYKIDELIREIGLTRQIILVNCVTEFGQQNPAFSSGPKKKAKQLIHQFFNDLMVASVQQYVEEVNQSRFQLMRTISHEVGNLLNGLSIPVNLLFTNIDQAKRDWVLSIFKKNLADMRGLLNQLTDYSRLVSGHEQIQVEPFDASLLCAELVAAYQPEAMAKGLALHFECDPDLKHVVSDRTRVKSIATNLLANALKYTDAGHICLSIHSVSPEEFAIVVEDTGVGIAPDGLGRVFEEFHRINPRADIHGAGLGLAITKRLVDLLSGRISVNSEIGQGSRFEVVLPKVTDSR